MLVGALVLPGCFSAPPVVDTGSSVETQPAATTVSPPDVEVLSVTDGDTIRVRLDGRSEPLRLIGINAPEQGECLATEATGRLAELVDGRPVRLEADLSDRDDFGRLLRYVYTGEVFVNRALVREGLALAHRYEPDTSRSEDLEVAQTAAEAEEIGMWDPDGCGPTTGRGIEISEIHHDAEGDDNTNLNDEWVELSNPSDRDLDLTGWRVKDESASHRYSFPSGFLLEAGANLRLHTGCGDDNPSELFWCEKGSAVWNNSGDTVFVLDPNGNIIDSRSYSD